MSGISETSASTHETTPLLTGSRDLLFPEDSNPYEPYAQYHDPQWSVKVKYHDYSPIIPKVKEVFESREDMLEEVVATRIEGREKGDYTGFEDGAWKKIKGAVYRFFRGIGNYHKKLLGRGSSLRHPNYSVKPVKDFDSRLTPGEIGEKLGLKPEENYKLWAKSRWLKNGLNGLAFRHEDGRMVMTHDAVTSSNDRTSGKIAMCRAVDDYIAGSIAYTGRPDTREKAVEQIEFMFQRELEKNEAVKGITDKDGVYEFTYMVTNLMSPIGVIGLATFDELGSIEREGEILQALSNETLVIDGKKVRVKPIYFNQMFNQGLYYRELGMGANQVERNAKGYDTLLTLAHDATLSEADQLLLSAAIKHLENPTKLLPEEEVFYRDLIAKLLQIPVVFHCKSSTDRTIIALAISMALHQWRNTGQSFLDSEGALVPHKILQTDTFKELFMANTLHGHQVTRVSRTAQGTVKDHTFDERVLGFQWDSNPIALRMLPDRYKVKDSTGTFHPWFISTLKKVMKVGQFFFSWATSYFSNKLAYYEKAYPMQRYHVESPLFEVRSLQKPPGMIV